MTSADAEGCTHHPAVACLLLVIVATREPLGEYSLSPSPFWSKHQCNLIIGAPGLPNSSKLPLQPWCTAVAHPVGPLAVHQSANV
jgi:hypothetical protein